MASRRERLAQRRKAVGFTQEGLAEQLDIDRSTVVRWENGDSEPQPWLRPKIARALHVSVEQLAELLAETAPVTDAPTVSASDLATHPNELRADSLRSDRPAGGAEEPLSPAPYAAANVVFSLNLDETDRLVHVSHNPRQIDRATLKSLATVLHESRRLEDMIGAVPLLPSVRAQLTLFEHLIVEARSPLRRRVILLGSQYAQFAGWLHSSANQPNRAHNYYDRAAEWGLEAEDTNMVATVLSMKGHLAYRLNQLGSMLGLSEAAARQKRTSPGVRSLAVQQTARAHALLGNGDDCDRNLDTATVLAEKAAVRRDSEPPWIYFFSPDYLVMQRGRAYRYLGRWRQAEELLSAGLAALPPEIRDAEWALTYKQDLEMARKSM